MYPDLLIVHLDYSLSLEHKGTLEHEGELTIPSCLSAMFYV